MSDRPGLSIFDDPEDNGDTGNDEAHSAALHRQAIVVFPTAKLVGEAVDGAHDVPPSHAVTTL